MARINHSRQRPGLDRAGILDQTRAAPRKNKPYKIVLEAVTQEKKKLHSIMTYTDNAPHNFGFVPTGHGEFTEWCKEQCRQRNLDVHVVSAKPKNRTHADPEKLAHHVHRVGHHFPLSVIELACNKFDYTYDKKQGLCKGGTRDTNNWISQQVENYSSRQLPQGGLTTDKETRDHITGAIREMFPKIPEEDLLAILKHAFEEGTDRVGNAKELSLPRRVQLAVVAHIRHTYTDYDKILKTGGWLDARAKVEHVSLAKLKEWRDEIGGQSDELEETFREIIVLDDDEDEPNFGRGGRDQSVEIVSRRVFARDIRSEQYFRHPEVLALDATRSSRRTNSVRSLPFPPSAAPRADGSQDSHASFRLEHLQPVHSRPFNEPTRTAPKVMRSADGRLYEVSPDHVDIGKARNPGASSHQPRELTSQLQPIVEKPRTQKRPEYYPHPPPRHAHEGYVHPSSRAMPFDTPHSRLPHPLSRRASDQDTVIPSVENVVMESVSSRSHVNASPPTPQHGISSRGYADMHSPKRKALLPPMDTSDLRPGESSERQRLAHSNPGLRYEPDFRQPNTRRPTMDCPPVDNRDQRQIEYIDLTSRDLRPTMEGRGHQYPAHTAAAPRNHFTVPCPPPRSLPQEVRNGYHGGQPGEAYPLHMPDDRMYVGRPPPPPPPANGLMPVRYGLAGSRAPEERNRLMHDGPAYDLYRPRH